MSCVSLGNTPLNLGIGHVWILLCDASLFCRPGRIADDDLNRQFLLTLGAFAVVWQPCHRETHPLGMQVECIRQDNAAERLIGAVTSHAPMERFLNMYCCDIVGEQDKLVGVKFFAVLPRQIGILDQR